MSIGYTPDLFWKSTPRQIRLLFKAAGKRMTREYNERVTQAFQMAMFSTSQKRIKLETYLVTDETATKPTQSWEERLAIAEQWAAATMH